MQLFEPEGLEIFAFGLKKLQSRDNDIKKSCIEWVSETNHYWNGVYTALAVVGVVGAIFGLYKNAPKKSR